MIKLKSGLIGSFTAIFTSVIDLISKNWALENLNPNKSITLCKYLKLSYEFNEGIFGGSIDNSIILNTKYSIINMIIFLMFIFIRKLKLYIIVGYGLIIGGLFGNVYQCFIYNGVIDFIKCDILLSKNYISITLNFADFAIFTGLILIFKDLLDFIRQSVNYIYTKQLNAETEIKRINY